MRTFYSISAAAALITMALTSCGSDPATSRDKELVYEGSMLEPQIGEQAVTPADADTLNGNMAIAEIKVK